MADQKTRLQTQLDLDAQRVKYLLDSAQRDGRNLTDGEEREIVAMQKRIDHATDRLDELDTDAATNARIDQMTGGVGGGPRVSLSASPGTLVTADATYLQWVKEGRHRQRGEKSPAVEVPYSALMVAATLTENPASGGALVVPDYRPGIVLSAQRRIVVMDLLMPGTTDSNLVSYMKEKQFINAAAPVAEGAAKPESTLVYEQVQAPVRKIAHWIPATEEILEDSAQTRSLIDGRLRLGVQLAEEDQILNGNGVAPNFLGLLQLPGLAPTVVQTAPESAADAIMRQIATIATTALEPPSALVMNPVDWFPMRTLKTTDGSYIGPSPFEQPLAPTLWGLPVAVTPAIAAKTVLVGAYASMAQFFRKGGVRIESSNSHADFFIRNLVAIRGEERGALAVYREAAFGKVTLL